MANFGANIQIIADKLTEINTSLQTISAAIQSGTLTIDPELIDAINSLAFNGEVLDLGEAKIVCQGKAFSIEI